MGPAWLVAYDFSPQAAAVVQKSLPELNAVKGTLYMVHVFHTPITPTSFESVGSEAVFESAAEFSSALKKNAEEHLSKVAQGLAKHFSQITFQVVVREGDTVEEIIDAATELKVDRVVVGTHGRTGMGRVLMGSVAERIVRLSPVSVLVVKT